MIHRISFLITSLLSLVTAAQHPLVTHFNVFDTNSLTTEKKIGDGTHHFYLYKEIDDSQNLGVPISRKPSSLKKNNKQILLGFPQDLIGEQVMFGGVITGVSAIENESLGRLKLTDIPPIHGITKLQTDEENNLALTLVGCPRNCSETSTLINIIKFPVIAVDDKKDIVVIDLSTLGEELNLTEIVDPRNQLTREYEHKKQKTTWADYSLSTLVFDIESSYASLDPEIDDLVITARWFIKLMSHFNPAFEVRIPQLDVGFFKTDRSRSSKITRFSQRMSASDTGLNAPVKYYIKNVPEPHKEAFANALGHWNFFFKELSGQNLIQFSFVDPEDSIAPLLTPGDIRYNIIEWDLVNKAPYGGLGPSIANQYTGELLSANVLVQGPEIIRIYKKWFNVNKKVAHLKKAGEFQAAEVLLAQTKKTLLPQKPQLPIHKVSLNSLQMRTPAQMPMYEDPLMKRYDFEPLPEELTYDQYIKGYFIELISHEFGHNLGLRHNFRGNLYAKDDPKEGEVSSSIMEYLNRPSRHLNRIGPYDVMAIGYGYFGIPPSQKGTYCTDENVINSRNFTFSPECSRDDDTSDPFGFFENRLKYATNLLIGRDHNKTPGWTWSEIKDEVETALHGMVYYAASAPYTFNEWTHFKEEGRPETADDVTAYIVETLNSIYCDNSFYDVVMSKESSQAKEKVINNIDSLRKSSWKLIQSWGVIEEDDFSCWR